MGNDDKKPPKRRRAKRTPAKTQSVVSNTRIPAALWERCAWRAIELGTTQAEVQRQALVAFCAGAKPPKTDETLVLLGVVGGRREAYNALAAKMHKPTAVAMVELLDALVRQNLGSAPYLENGEWRWDGPKNA